MQINSLVFIALFLLLLIIYYAIPNNIKYLTMLGVSLLFYTTFGLRCVVVLSVTIILSYLAARLIFVTRYNKAWATVCLWGVILLFAPTFLLFRIESGLSAWAAIGFSFYSLQAIGYVIDIYTGKFEPEKNLLRYPLYISFFPTVTSGPIQKSEFLNQIRDYKAPDYDGIRHGLLRIGYGLFLKNVIADNLAKPVNYAFNYWESQSGVALLEGAILFALQLYLDFDGYSNIAIGMAETLGFKLNENFRQPYFSKSVKEFWSRWHVSLSTWLRDYIYIPLGGSKAGRIRTALNILIVFAVSGIWHGSGLTFLIWGMLHGIYRVFEYAVSNSKMNTKKPCGPAISFLKMTVCFIAVDFAWIFFRAETVSQAGGIVKKIILNFDLLGSFSNRMIMLGFTKVQWICVLIGLCVVLAVDILHYHKISISRLMLSTNIIFRWVAYTVFVVFMLWYHIYSYGGDASAFIYAQF